MSRPRVSNLASNTHACIRCINFKAAQVLCNCHKDFIISPRLSKKNKFWQNQPVIYFYDLCFSLNLQQNYISQLLIFLMSIYKIKRSRHLLVYFKHALNRNYFYSKSWTLWNLSLSLIILPWVKFHHISFTKFWLYDLKNKTKQNIVLRSIYFAFVGFPKIIAKVIDNWLISNCRSVHTRTKASWKTSVHQSQPTCTILV